MKSRPTIALACILKNEAHNIGPFLSSISGCFDKIFMADTGSTDGSVDILKSEKSREVAGCDIEVSNFDWVHDFSLARNFVFSQVPEEFDYIMWLDLDDALSDRDKFIHFRDHSLHCCDAWLAYYNYAFVDGNPVCTFYRERIVRNNGAWDWHYFVHEGLVANRPQKTQLIQTWTVDHRRTDEDSLADKARNVKIFEEQIKKGAELVPRMTYYYGKELFDAGRFLDAAEWLQKACEIKEGLQIHDRVMAMQTLSMAYGKNGQWEKALHIALNGLNLQPTRAEFWCCIGDALTAKRDYSGAKVFYEGAKHCRGGDVQGALYTSPMANSAYPAHQLAQIYLSEGNYLAAEREVNILETLGHESAPEFRKKVELYKSKDVVPKSEELTEVDEIVISTPPNVVVNDWDEKVLAEKGLGGSETACVEIARLLKETTKKPVKVFMNREKAEKMPSGVEYLPIAQLEEYFRNYKPSRHIAWRHCFNLTEAPTYVWSHDLITPNANRAKFEKLWALTPFHKHFYIDMMGIDPEKIDIVNNGIEPTLYQKKVAKNPFKVIFSSSPDRGWEPAINICKKAREKVPNLELHLFYGTQNMRKMGMEDEANRLDALVRENDWVHFHGFVSKDELATHFMESAVWLYPADFIETSCITAMEAVCAKAFPLVRNMGALPDTLQGADCEILDENPLDEKHVPYWAERLVYHLENMSWQKMNPDIESYSWKKRLEPYLQSMKL